MPLCERAAQPAVYGLRSVLTAAFNLQSERQREADSLAPDTSGFFSSQEQKCLMPVFTKQQPMVQKHLANAEVSKTAACDVTKTTSIFSTVCRVYKRQPTK